MNEKSFSSISDNSISQHQLYNEQKKTVLYRPKAQIFIKLWITMNEIELPKMQNGMHLIGCNMIYVVIRFRLSFCRRVWAIARNYHVFIMGETHADHIFIMKQCMKMQIMQSTVLPMIMPMLRKYSPKKKTETITQMNAERKSGSANCMVCHRAVQRLRKTYFKHKIYMLIAWIRGMYIFVFVYALYSVTSKHTHAKCIAIYACMLCLHVLFCEWDQISMRLKFIHANFLIRIDVIISDQVYVNTYI